MGLSGVVLPECIAPHLFELIEVATFWQHDMDYYIYIINQDPLQGLLAFLFVGNFFTAFFNLDFHKIGNCLNLGVAAGFANYKEVCSSLLNLPKVKGDNLITFLFLDSLYYGFKKF